ncbi:gamma-glutamyltransferase family protein, partial [Nonomuraea sp. NPDC004297]
HEGGAEPAQRAAERARRKTEHRVPQHLLRSGGASMPVTGPLTVTVPGVLAGWATLSELAGRLPFRLLFEQAIRYAREGVPTAPGVAAALRLEAEHLRADPGIGEIFFPGGQPLAEGRPLVQPALADTLSAVAEQGPDAFYAGALGAGLAARLRPMGSPLSAEDLARHATEVAEPLSAVFRGEEYLTAPPNSQGLHLLQILGLIDRLPEAAGAGLLARVFEAASRDRDRHLADPRHADVPEGTLLGDAHLDALAEQVLAGGGCGAGRAGAGARPSGDTVAVVAADGAGNAVSLIQSLFHSFGSGILDPVTGVILHNRGAFFDLAPGVPNRLAGGKRPAHTLMPVLTRRDGVLSGAHGTMGGKAQPQIHAQLALRLHAGDEPAAALRHPRWVVGGLEVDAPAGTVAAESTVPDRTVASLRAAGFPVTIGTELDEEVGHGQLVRRAGDGFRAASDPRCDGSAVTRD